MDEAISTLIKSIERETEFFTRAIDYIPPDHYGYDDEIRETLRDRKHALINDKLTYEQRSTLSNKTKGRLARLDDRQCKTISQISAYLLDVKKHEKGKKRQAPNLDDGNQSGPIKKKSKSVIGQKSKPVENMNGPAASTADRQHLLSKLQSKLDDLRAKREPLAGAKQGVDYEEKKRLKRRLSKAKLKERRRQEKGQIPNAPKSSGQEKTSPQPNKKPLADESPRNIQPRLHPTTVIEKKKSIQSISINGTSSSKRPALVDKDGKVVFSKFDFAVPGFVQDETKSKWAKKNSGKDYKRLLDKQERLESKLHQLDEQGNVEGAKRLKLKTQWDAAALRAKGEKVKDDPNLLKKNLKQKEKRKQQSKRKWDNRKETVQKKQEEKQKKRKENIQSKKKEMKDKKLTKARKKGRLV